jgi:hypothetical protein
VGLASSDSLYEREWHLPKFTKSREEPMKGGGQ